MAAQKNYGLIVVVNSPGAALIGDDLELMLEKEVKEIPCFAIENTGYSGTFGEGFENALIQLFKKELSKGKVLRPRTVNLLGINILQKHYDGNIEAIKTLLEVCGIDVLCTPGALDSLSVLKQMTEAALNVVVYPAYGLQTALYLEENFGMPFVVPKEGPPIGFEATEDFIKIIAEFFDINPQSAVERVKKTRAKSFLHLARYTSLFGMPKGAFFSIKAEVSVTYALTKWLVSYLGMIPAAIEILDDTPPEVLKRLLVFLESIGCRETFGRAVNREPVQMIFADGTIIAQLKQQHDRCAGMEIALPSLGYLDVMPKTLFGDQGSLLFLENILNGLRYVG